MPSVPSALPSPLRYRRSAAPLEVMELIVPHRLLPTPPFLMAVAVENELVMVPMPLLPQVLQNIPTLEVRLLAPFPTGRTVLAPVKTDVVLLEHRQVTNPPVVLPPPVPVGTYMVLTAAPTQWALLPPMAGIGVKFYLKLSACGVLPTLPIT